MQPRSVREWEVRAGYWSNGTEDFLLRDEHTLVDASDIALGARDRNIGPSLDSLRCVRGAHHRGNAQLSRHDGRMAGAAAPIGDDAGRDLHDRLPIRAGGRCHQDLARLEGCEIARGRNAACAPGYDLLSYR